MHVHITWCLGVINHTVIFTPNRVQAILIDLHITHVTTLPHSPRPTSPWISPLPAHLCFHSVNSTATKINCHCLCHFAPIPERIKLSYTLLKLVEIRAK